MHTSGPWKWDFTENGEIVIYQDRGIKRHIARVSDGVTDLEQAENASLLVASPDMLDALLDVESKIVDFEAGKINWRPDDFLMRVRAAIAKATDTP